MQLSDHFSLEELTVTSHREIDNSLDPDNPQHKEIISHLSLLAMSLERVRMILGDKRIHITSGFRCPALNRAVGSKPSSAHTVGFAADFVCPEVGSPLVVAKLLADTSSLAWDQLIYERPSSSQWVHISFAPLMRQEILTIDPLGTHVGIVALYHK